MGRRWAPGGGCLGGVVGAVDAAMACLGVRRKVWERRFCFCSSLARVLILFGDIVEVVF